MSLLCCNCVLYAKLFEYNKEPTKQNLCVCVYIYVYTNCKNSNKEVQKKMVN